MIGRAWVGPAIALLLALESYAAAVRFLGGQPRMSVAPELAVTLPRLAQVVFAGGDRHLAANLAGFRVLVASTDRMGPDDYKVQATLQGDIAFLNPAHEDNYYIAAAILPWAGEVAAAQAILRRAADARPFDWQPLFYYGFGRYHFYRDPAGGAQALIEAAPRAAGEQQDQWALQNLAAIWIERGYKTETAAKLVDSMSASAPPGNFRKYLAVRAKRLHDLARLRDLAGEFQSRQGRPLASLDELVSGGLLSELPKDALGVGFALDATGQPVLGKP